MTKERPGIMDKRLSRPFEHFDTAILAGSWQSIVIACTGFALDYFLNLALSQWLEPAEFGDYSVAVSVAIFGGMFALLGTDQALMQFLPQYLEEKDWPRVRGFLSFSFVLVTATSLFGSGLAFIIVYFTGAEWGDHPIKLALFAIPVISLVLLSSKALRGFKHVLLATVPLNIAVPLLIMLGGYFISTRDVVTDWDFVWIFLVSFLLVLSLQLLALGRDLIGPLQQAGLKFELKEWGTSAGSLMLAATLFLAMEQLGVYFCEILASEEDVAIYTVLVKHARFLLIIYMAVNLITIPFITPTLIKKDKNALQKLYGTSMHIVLWGGLIPLIIFIFKGDTLLAAFGPEYEVGYQGLLILMAAYYLNFVAGFSVPFLQFSGNKKIVVISITIALLVEFLLFILLVPSYGFNGAAWSMAATLCALSLWMTLQCNLRLGLRPFRLSQG